MNRYFVNTFLKNEDIIVIEGEELHHLLNVMRNNVGSEIIIINGQGQIAQGQIIEITKKKASVQLTKVLQEPEDKLKIILAQAMPRLNRLDYIVEKCTELGVNEIWLFPGNKSEKKFISKEQEKRLTRIIIAATKQCGRFYLPQIIIKDHLQKWSKPNGQLFFGDITKNAPWLIHEAKNINKKQIIFFIGPESGFDNEEITTLKEWGSKGVTLHQNILRTDTAPVTALSIISQLNY